MSKSKNLPPYRRRRQYLVDRPVQGAVVKHAMWYWVWTTIVFGGVVGFCRILPAWLSNSNEPWGRIWFHLGPYTLASAVLFPIIVTHAIRFSNRFAGPMVRVRRSLKALANGEPAEYLKFREGDYWLDIAEHINEISILMHGSDCPAAQQQARQAEQAPQEQPSEQEEETPVLSAAVEGSFEPESTPQPTG